MELVRKITAATLAQGVALKAITEKTYLGRIIGFAKGYEDVTTQYGIAKKLIGEFMAELPNGEKYMSPVCYLPELVSGMVVSALDDENNHGVNFGFDISANPNAKSATGYDWGCQPLMEVKVSAGVLEFAKNLPALPNAGIPASENNELPTAKTEPEPEAKQRAHKPKK